MGQRRRWWPSLILLVACSCGPTVVNDGCFGGGVFAYVTIDVPAGMASIASVEATGACRLPLDDCTPANASCDGRCDCTLDVEAMANAGGAPTIVCHVTVTSVTGKVSSRDLSFSVEQGAPCPVLVPSTPNVTVDFADAAVGDAGAADGVAAD